MSWISLAAETPPKDKFIEWLEQEGKTMLQKYRTVQPDWEDFRSKGTSLGLAKDEISAILVTFGQWLDDIGLLAPSHSPYTVEREAPPEEPVSEEPEKLTPRQLRQRRRKEMLEKMLEEHREYKGEEITPTPEYEIPESVKKMTPKSKPEEEAGKEEAEAVALETTPEDIRRRREEKGEIPTEIEEWWREQLEMGEPVAGAIQVSSRDLEGSIDEKQLNRMMEMVSKKSGRNNV